ncbi:CvfD/Ygs/GSP13 family RNA-binding post-transcriptional regulator [Lentilactobacillus kisonensis]|nr:CvfD/Ygs/GSP13 family RNA-binding post-transcriptional regulator [Lentilactobacillus kisonensis]EHO53877.1 S1 RNA binding domain protein [Lentilactobacillus kisonensis F0435]
MDLKIGMKVHGVVTGVQAYGVFVDVGDHNQGLIHISECQSGYVDDINKLFKAGQTVEALIIDIDEYTKKISLSTRSKKIDETVLSRTNPQRLKHIYYWTNYRIDLGFTTVAKYRQSWLEEAIKNFE